jgi:hypothetical protein
MKFLSLFAMSALLFVESIGLYKNDSVLLNQYAYSKVDSEAFYPNVPTVNIDQSDLSPVSLVSFTPSLDSTSPFGNPAGCSTVTPALSSEQMLEKVQVELGGLLDLSERRVFYTWNGPQNSMLNTENDPFVYEFSMNEFQRPFTYKADHIATTFMVNGFTVWFRMYGGDFRMLAIPMTQGVLESPWADYVTSYWEVDGIPDDEFVFPVTKKLPCHWVIDEGYVHEATLHAMFNFNWQVPDFLSAGRKYLASNCHEANQISREQIGYWDASSMCGPLAWQIMKDANAFPYRIGNWYADAMIFTAANPKWNGRPWVGFDPETYDVFHTDSSMPAYDFDLNGHLETGDIVYSYSGLYRNEDEKFDHIFLVAGIDENGSRLSISNMVQNLPVADCFIHEVVLYTPGDMVSGVIHKEWNSFDYGRTGLMGFDVFRWKWQTYHLEGEAREYVVRVGDTIETIAFDWKISPEQLISENQLNMGEQLSAGQTIVLPAPN